MIHFAGYGWIDYEEVKRAWKRGLRGQVTGYPAVGCSIYAVGEGFFMHPIDTTIWDTQDIVKREDDHTYSIGQSPIYGNNYCGYLNSF